MKYRHEEHTGTLIKQLCHEEDGIMRAEQSVVKVSRDYIRFAKKMAEMKNNFDMELELERIRKIGHAEGHAEGIIIGDNSGYKRAKKEDYQEKLETARKLKARSKLSIEEIAEDTGLSVDVVMSL